MPFDINDALTPLSVGFSYSYSLFMMGNIVLNGLLVLVAFRGRLLNSTADALILNLAAADLGIALTNLPVWLSNAVAGRWATGSVGCLWNGFCTSYFVFNTVVTLFIITAERYYMIVSMQRLSRTVCLRILGACWVAALVYASVPLLVSSSMYMPQPSGTYCAPNWSSEELSDTLFKALICAMISGTVLVMVYGYYRIIRKFRQSQRDVLGMGKHPEIVDKAVVKPVQKVVHSTLPTPHTPVLQPLKDTSDDAKEPIRTASNLDSSGASTIAVLLKNEHHSNIAIESVGDTPTTITEDNVNPLGNFRRTVMRKSSMIVQPLVRAIRTVSDSARTASTHSGNSSSLTNNSPLSASQNAARRMETMLIKRAVAVVGAFMVCWCMYLFVWIYTWVYRPRTAPPIVDCIAALLVAIIGVVNPCLTFTLDNRFKTVIRDIRAKYLKKKLQKQEQLSQCKPLGALTRANLDNKISSPPRTATTTKA